MANNLPAHAFAGSESEHYQGEVAIASELDIVSARKAVREAAVDLGFGVTDVTRIVTAASELARNTFLYAGSGRMRWRRLSNGGKAAIELVFEDSGPGISDVASVMQEGYTSSGGLGMGLPGTRRLMDEMEISSEPGKGTTVTVRKWRREF
jgi:serine/threonine-protein kinase RsbT